MPADSPPTFAESAKGFIRSPLGIIGLFIVLVYGFAALVFGLGAEHLESAQREPLVWFLVLFPVLVLVVFTYLVVFHHQKLYGPGDFTNQADFLKLQEQLQRTTKQVSILEEVLPVALDIPEEPPETRPAPAKSHVPGVEDPDDPQKGKWNGKREDNFRKVEAGTIRRLQTDKNFFQIPLTVSSTDPVNHSLTGMVKFHLHDTFDPDVQEVEVENGVAQLTLVSYGAFTVGVETEDGTKLEINLADQDIHAPEDFKAA